MIDFSSNKAVRLEFAQLLRQHLFARYGHEPPKFSKSKYRLFGEIKQQ